ncbi:MAG: hypothetical protein M0R75_15265 [Dehalococcoidia bacterium]|nr:hypothetical protein [Dehalococcoidia bacterium]
MDVISLIIHVTAAAIFIGPQVLMFYAVTPASWLIEDEKLKRQVVTVIARRFAMLAGTSLVVLLVTGLYQFYSVVPEPVREDMMGYRFGMIFMLKMTLFTLVVVLVMVHAMVFARRIRRLADAFDAGEATAAELERARMQSFLFSALLLFVSIGVLWLGVALGHGEYSHVPV